MKISGVILAAGKGTRMKSSSPKVLQTVLGTPMITYAQSALSKLDSKYVILGYESDSVSDHILEGYKIVEQKEQLGTGHAVITLVDSKEFKSDNSDYIVIIPGDVPLIDKNDLDKLIDAVIKNKSALGLITAEVSNPSGYGRIIRTKENAKKIVEEADASEEEKSINEINSGIYCVNKEFMLTHINTIKSDNAQNEFYLTDLIEIAFQNKQEAVIVQVIEDTIKGVNSMSQLNDVEDTLKEKLISSHMENGVYFQDPSTTYIDEKVTIQSGTKIFANCHLTGNTEIQENCEIGPNSLINDSKIGEGSKVLYSVIDGSEIESNGKIGPYAHLRVGSSLGDNVKVGAFAETKNSKISKDSKVPHLAYVGDAELEEGVNFSAGAITVNYDGKEKQKTEIKKGAFVGSDAMLVAPVTIGEGAMIGAGSVITKDVPPKSLGIERNQQKNIEGYMDRKKSSKDK